MSQYGDEIIIKKVVSDNENAPVMRAEISINGQKYKAGLWVWTRKDNSEVRDKAGNLQYKGKIEVDDYEPSSGTPQPAARQAAPAPREFREVPPSAEDFRDSDIPF